MTDDCDLGKLTLDLAGQRIEGVWDRLCRYCGLEWSGGPPETWAYRYYDAVETDEKAITPVDVLATTALHPGISRADLAYFWDHRDELSSWANDLPPDVALRDADDELIRRLEDVATWEDAPHLSLLTKVLHRKRPGLIPLVDREVLDLYGSITGSRKATAAWPELLRALRQDLGGQNALHLALISTGLEQRLGRTLPHVRLVDIVIWMGSRR